MPEQHRAIITPLEIVSRKRAGYVQPTEPAWIPGLFMLFRSDAYARIGGFDERFFMYYEDTDLSKKFQVRNWPIRWIVGARVIHLGGGSSTDSPGASR